MFFVIFYEDRFQNITDAYIVLHKPTCQFIYIIYLFITIFVKIKYVSITFAFHNMQRIYVSDNSPTEIVVKKLRFNE